MRPEGRLRRCRGDCCGLLQNTHILSQTDIAGHSRALLARHNQLDVAGYLWHRNVSVRTRELNRLIGINEWMAGCLDEVSGYTRPSACGSERGLFYDSDRQRRCAVLIGAI